MRPEQSQQASRALSVCSEVLQSNPENVNVLKDRAEAYIQEEQYEEGTVSLLDVAQCTRDFLVSQFDAQVPTSSPESCYILLS